MQIEIIDVGSLNTHEAKGGRKYQSIEVTYKGPDGRASNKKLMSFSNPEVFKTAQTWSKGDLVNVVSEKDTAGYWQWTSIGGEVPESRDAPLNATYSPTPSKPATRVTGSTYETPEERKIKQRLIVRQSSLTTAIALNPKTDVDSTLALAEKLVDWVYEEAAPDYDIAIDDITSDIPL